MEESNRQKWERYIQNLRRVRTLSRPQFPPETAPEILLETIQGNAVRCFDLMKENNALLGELVYTRDAKTLSDSDIAELEEAAGRLFNYANSEDCGVAYKIHEAAAEGGPLPRRCPHDRPGAVLQRHHPALYQCAG